MNDKNLDLYRPNVGMMVLNANDEVFVAQRIDSPGPAWQMPQGGIDEGEDILAAALRELREETSMADVIVLYESPQWYFYDLPKALQKKLWGGGYLGQRQKWVLMRYLGLDQDINIQTPHPEFLSWQWVSAHTLPDLAVDFKRNIYRTLVADLWSKRSSI
jgi:putative (di)nucleoside polyphosphate hydrolase